MDHLKKDLLEGKPRNVRATTLLVVDNIASVCVGLHLKQKRGRNQRTLT